ncbi:MAG TPA: PHP domain-containing protein [Bacillota bacterium]|nr:PHP domain-containing protein [Bacillota bacterium]
MDQEIMAFIENLNHEKLEVRLQSLRELKKQIEAGKLPRPIINGNYVNNHIHTTYSFSPYSPTKAVWMAYNAGLITAGIMDHDSLSGAEEFIEAGRIIGMATTIGFECRVDMSKTILKGRRINNPDQKSNIYMALHSIPHSMIPTVKQFLAPYLKERNQRDRLMTERINNIFQLYHIHLDFDRDIVPLSKSSEGGSITERHILFALTQKLIAVYGKGNGLLSFLKNDLKIKVSPKQENFLADVTNPYYEYDLLGVLKSELVSSFYIDAIAECPDVRELIDLSNRIGAISAYAYLGDVGDSVTGDKKAQKFEDDFLDLLFDTIKELRFNAVTYMPSRNSSAQLKRIKELCDQYGFFQISGEDINSPRQSFFCDALLKPEFQNLIDSTWALIGHEKTATQDIRNGMFSEKTLCQCPDLNERIKIFKEIGLKANQT